MNRHFFSRRIRFISLFWLVLFIFGCVVTPASDAPLVKIGQPCLICVLPQWSTTDLTSGATLPSGTTNGVQWQVGNYWSDDLQIYGLICTPPASSTSAYPVAILNHGIGGAGPNVFVGCTQMAQSGWLTAISAYRGESLSAPGFVGLSQGSPDICDGDVDDVSNLLFIVTQMPNANGNQVFMWGHSEGSCITDLAIEQGANVQIAVSLDGPADFMTWSNAPTLLLIPANPSQRSSVNNPTALNQLWFLRIQAEGDTTVTPDQACELASKLSKSQNYYLNPNVTPPAPQGVDKLISQDCKTLKWVNTPLPEQGPWPQTVLLMYGLDNNYQNASQQIQPSPDYHLWIVWKAWPEIASFVNTFAKSNGWNASLPSAFVPFE